MMTNWQSNLAYLNRVQALKEEIADLHDAIARGETHLAVWLERSQAEYRAMAGLGR